MVDAANSTPAARPRFLLRGNPPVYKPYGWEPVDAALSWIAFGTALRRWDWDHFMYTGASDGLTRAEVLHWLDKLSAPPAGVDAFVLGVPEAGLNISALPPSLRAAVENVTAIMHARQGRRPLDDARAIRRAATILRRTLGHQFQADARWGPYDWNDDMEALAAAERDLLRRVADESAPLFAWPGGPAMQPQDITAPRSRVPPILCAAPVSFGWDDTLLPCLRTDARRTVEPLFSGLVIPGDVLLTLWPKAAPAPAPAPATAPATAADVAASEPEIIVSPELVVPPEKRRARGPGGAPPKHYWPPFYQEIVRFVFMHGQQSRRSVLNPYMKDWAAEHMDTAPEDRTLEREVAKLAPHGGAIPE